jgi:8-oxo-dGTP diphosphatase
MRTFALMSIPNESNPISFPKGLKRAAALGFIKSGQQWLLLERNRPPHQGKWVPVGGKIEPHETPRAAMRREAFEETGIDIADWKFAGVLEETSPINYNWISFVFVAEIEWQAAPDCSEGILHWVDTVELPKALLPEIDRVLFDLLLQNKTFVVAAEYDDHLMLSDWRNELDV